MIESTKEQVAEDQGGFRPGMGCIYQIFVLKQLIENYKDKGRELHLHSWTWKRLMIKLAVKHCEECCMNVELMGT